MKKVLSRFVTWLSGAPNRKHHLDFLAALLSIPVLLSVIILNLSNIQNQNKHETPPNPTPQEKIIIVPQNNGQTTNKVDEKPTPTTLPTISQSCKKQVGPISISYPAEGQTVKDNPVVILIKYEDDSYCSVVWSYRINGGSWSDYNSNSVGLYNLTPGNIKFELRIQSTASSDQEQLERNFTYESPSATSSANSN